MHACFRCQKLILPPGKSDSWGRAICVCDEPVAEDRRKVPSVPAGYAAVPLEPDDEMKYRGRQAMKKHGSARDAYDEMVRVGKLKTGREQ